MSPPKICVVGSANLDLNTYTNRLPVPGETLHAHRFTMGYGGKGANQAVMAARLGADVVLVARVGNDLFGRDMLAHLRTEGIDTRRVTSTDGVPTGTAVITVDDAGRNTIAVTPGANGLLAPADVDAARSAIESARVLVCQQEVPIETNLAAMRLAVEAGVPVVFNPAPASTTIPAEAYRLSTVFCPNEHEAAVLTGKPVESPEEAEAAARELMARGAHNVVVTLGARGCVVVTARDVTALPAPAVEAVDTTGAGDAFIGSLAFFLARGDDLMTAAQRANRIAAISVQSPGTQTSFPRAADLPADLVE
ncbi:ribokinase : Ribokinase OS=Caldilinea aerophila (strain DSM 14535 / JCM 11387 / NBRC 104270 / STL-6-O1) GN=rbsK PE=4 SV=1: PfkB [Gemmata massiliana]|uniref:Ribokinase n=1 Tax=Gemmata massiliana TaxID=1210884 RepID=A0A6P2CZ25_9BACT|nr:ribokinase [Gemmata massiliana]VTR92412.1 ribokinase : Ribokinase OS=Caldilinea aerophila (strain DSM 14535 / JCM 11387 / NBRC 104270 / STL-6-O1) GN=rbsK PE=4 SV=1: PfkB [Gemmata massiliana]